MRGEYYRRRGWQVGSGLQTRARLEELGLRDVARELAGLVV
jgi:aldehyde:ferredoxin oxidoreductase